MDRKRWVSVGEWVVGERVRVGGGTAVVLKIEEAGDEPVFNLEVDADHCYRVGEQGILVHNMSNPAATPAQPSKDDCPPGELANFSFVGTASSGKTLLIGEGDLSFSQSLVENHKVSADKLTATTYDSLETLEKKYKGIEDRICKLVEQGVTFRDGVDATKLSDKITGSYNTVVFQFPHTGQRPSPNTNPQAILISGFLKSVKSVLAAGGRVIITIINNSHYRGAFQLPKAAKDAGFKIVGSQEFKASDYPAYGHRETNQDITQACKLLTNVKGMSM